MFNHSCEVHIIPQVINSLMHGQTHRHTHMRTHTHTPIHTHTHTDTHTPTHAHTHTHTHTTHTHMHTDDLHKINFKKHFKISLPIRFLRVDLGSYYHHHAIQPVLLTALKFDKLADSYLSNI